MKDKVLSLNFRTTLVRKLRATFGTLNTCIIHQTIYAQEQVCYQFSWNVIAIILTSEMKREDKLSDQVTWEREAYVESVSFYSDILPETTQ
jgi:hypothetical protein